jgi:hypothetical protein
MPLFTLLAEARWIYNRGVAAPPAARTSDVNGIAR